MKSPFEILSFQIVGDLVEWHFIKKCRQNPQHFETPKFPIDSNVIGTNVVAPYLLLVVVPGGATAIVPFIMYSHSEINKCVNRTNFALPSILFGTTKNNSLPVLKNI